ncbi:pseudouridine synthase [Staphylotrichum tortipilum]|uniref:Pseudouridine synthase n=1 Tax=Staphylotrichum tortipilum TaxID=2831512 RepID=A0AAN6MLJ1_9PEZI|nr:pseudouridine synthase [Staphylotrichum longicolle]
MSQRPGTHVPAVRAETEKALGITQRSAAINFAWTGDIRKRYTDFLVNEIRKDGTVLHLRDFEENEVTAPAQTDRKASAMAGPVQPENKPKVYPISDDECAAVVGLLGQSVAEKLIELDANVQAKKPMAPNERSVVFEPVTDRSTRAVIHQEIRRIFHSRFETVADSEGIITATASKWALNNRATNQNWSRRDHNSRNRAQAREFAEGGGDYLHFTLYKENKDTMDAVNTIARLIKIKASNFGFAGTKDRRAGTVQRISVYRQKASNLIWLNSRIPNVKVGDFAYSKEPLQLGQHGGNEFVITLKNCLPLAGDKCSLVQRMKMIQQAVECGLAHLKHNGYINYYGLQRFGTYSIGTHLLGMKILQGDYEGFIDDVLHVDEDLVKEVLSGAPQVYGVGKDSQGNRDDLNRARAITTWKTTKSAPKALEFLPKRFSSESAIIRHLGKNPKDFTGAVLSITRGMRMMYVHAYQSYVWNFVATRRWSSHGAKVIEGDLVLIAGSRRRDRCPDDEFNPYDDNDDDNIYAQVKALTADDVASGKYTIFDVVLPTPGYDVSYPQNDIGLYYAEFMGKPENGALSPYEMRRKQREFSLSGNYRPLIGRLIGDPQYAIRAYHDDTEQMYPTDLDYALHKKNAEKLAKAAAQPRPKSATKSADPVADPGAVNRWAHFAQNAAAYDDAMSNERRRKAEQEPASTRVPVTKETWVQTGIDGSAKRVKLARHCPQLENQTEMDLSRDDGSPVTPTFKADESEPSNPFPVGNGASLIDNPKAPSPEIFTDGPIPTIAAPKGVISTTGARGVSDQYYESTGRMPYFGPLPTGLTTQTTVDTVDSQQGEMPQTSFKHWNLSEMLKNPNFTPPAADATTADDSKRKLDSDIQAVSREAMEWYGGSLPAIAPLGPAGAEGTSIVKTEESGNGPSDAGLINRVALPELRTASDNPLSAVSTGIDEGSIDAKADKIAVILKFQLKASNYATVVLRELMGTTAEELVV